MSGRQHCAAVARRPRASAIGTRPQATDIGAPLRAPASHPRTHRPRAALRFTVAAATGTALCALAIAPAAAQESAPPIAAWSRTAAADETRGDAAERGAAVFNNWCSACHGRGPQNAPGTRSLEFKYRGELPAALEDRRDLTAELVALYVRNGVATMPFYRKTEISDADLEALAEYLAPN